MGRIFRRGATYFADFQAPDGSRRRLSLRTRDPKVAKERLRAGELLYGCFLRYPDPGLTELLALQGFDFLVLDGEHGTMEPRDCENMVRGADVRGVPALVRVPVNEPPVILRFMDTGALGVHVPLVSSADDAERAVRAVKYGPRGTRGLTGVRAAAYGQRESLAEYVERANAETLVVVQIETRAAESDS